jgi:hypothetical protein
VKKLENNIEKLIAEGKALVGYDQNEVRDEIESLQNSYLAKKGRLLQEIDKVKAANIQLKEKFDQFTESTEQDDLLNQLNHQLISRFIEDTMMIDQLKKELERVEKPYYEKLILRRKQKELAKQGVQEASDFLKSLQEDFSYLKKETVHEDER